MYAEDRLDHGRSRRTPVRVPPRGDVGRVAQAREAISRLVEHERHEVVFGAQAPDAVCARLCARKSAGAELGLVPVHAPVQLDFGQTVGMDEAEMEHRIGRRVAVRAPAERRQGVGRAPEVRAGDQHIDVARGPHRRIAVQRSGQERALQRHVGHAQPPRAQTRSAASSAPSTPPPLAMPRSARAPRTGERRGARGPAISTMRPPSRGTSCW